MEDLGEVKSVDNQGICDGNSHNSRLTNISNLIFDMKEQGVISKESFLAIAAIDTLHGDTPVDDTIPLALFGLSEPELDHIKQLLFPKKQSLPPQYHIVP